MYSIIHLDGETERLSLNLKDQFQYIKHNPLQNYMTMWGKNGRKVAYSSFLYFNHRSDLSFYTCKKKKNNFRILKNMYVIAIEICRDT